MQSLFNWGPCFPRRSLAKRDEWAVSPGIQTLLIKVRGKSSSDNNSNNNMLPLVFFIYDPFEEPDGSLELFPALLKMLHGEVELFECLLKAGWLS